jgi:hypothetical protein
MKKLNLNWDESESISNHSSNASVIKEFLGSINKRKLIEEIAKEITKEINKNKKLFGDIEL